MKHGSSCASGCTGSAVTPTHGAAERILLVRVSSYHVRSGYCTTEEAVLPVSRCGGDPVSVCSTSETKCLYTCMWDTYHLM